MRRSESRFVFADSGEDNPKGRTSGYPYAERKAVRLMSARKSGQQVDPGAPFSSVGVAKRAETLGRISTTWGELSNHSNSAGIGRPPNCGLRKV